MDTDVPGPPGLPLKGYTEPVVRLERPLVSFRGGAR